MKTIQTSTLPFLVREPKNNKASHTVFFFSLSASDSLTLPPFCHPVDTLVENGARVISTTLPDHEDNARPYGIQEIWQKKIPAIETFLNDLSTGIKELVGSFSTPFSTMGISRGAFIALHMAARLQEIEKVTCFAPMLTIKAEKKLSIDTIKGKLIDKSISLFVGDHDTLIGTENVVALHHYLNKKSKIKISPSIGRGGHGTSDENFKEGALWLIQS